MDFFLLLICIKWYNIYFLDFDPYINPKLSVQPQCTEIYFPIMN